MVITSVWVKFKNSDQSNDRSFFYIRLKGSNNYMSHNDVNLNQDNRGFKQDDNFR